MPVRGFISEPDAYGYFAAHKDKCKRPVEFAPGEWEVPNGSTEVTMADRLKGQRRPSNRSSGPA